MRDSGEVGTFSALSALKSGSEHACAERHFILRESRSRNGPSVILKLPERRASASERDARRTLKDLQLQRLWQVQRILRSIAVLKKGSEMWRKLPGQISVVVLLFLSASTLYCSLRVPPLTQTSTSTFDSSFSSADVRTDTAGGCGLTMLFGAFCALWAQNSGRRPLLWFILGVFFNVIAVLVLLYKNSEDIQSRRAAERERQE